MSVGRVDYYAGWGHDAIRPPFPDEVWDPFYPFPAVQPPLALTRFEWRETSESHVLTAHVPGARKEEVKVEVEGRMLKISGERKAEKGEEGDTWRTEERRSEAFVRSFRLPEDGRVAEVTAAMEKDGVFTVTVPKGKAKVNEVKEILIV